MGRIWIRSWICWSWLCRTRLCRIWIWSWICWSRLCRTWICWIRIWLSFLRILTLGYYGKRSADAEPEAKADAGLYYGGYGYGLGYAGLGYSGLGYAGYGYGYP